MAHANGRCQPVLNDLQELMHVSLSPREMSWKGRVEVYEPSTQAGTEQGRRTCERPVPTNSGKL